MGQTEGLTPSLCYSMTDGNTVPKGNRGDGASYPGGASGLGLTLKVHFHSGGSRFWVYFIAYVIIGDANCGFSKISYEDADFCCENNGGFGFVRL